MGTAQQDLPRFMVDTMLIKLGKYLRILGLDAEWEKEARTHDLIRRANREGRIFLTRNRRIPDEDPVPDRLMRIQSANPVDQLKTVLAETGIDPRPHLFTTCIRCNRRLEQIPDKRTICDRVHPNVFARHDRFYTCPSCNTVFWKGSHVENTCRKLGLPLPDP